MLGSVWMPVEGQHRVNLELKSRLETMDFMPSIVARVRSKFLAIIPEVEKHFNIKLNDCQQPKFAVYRKGHFFTAHTDASVNENSPQPIKDRKAAIIVFLNDESPSPRANAYCGGNLTFYGLMPETPFDKFGLPLTGERGLLVAFLPTLLHEVMPVTHGERFVIVNWYV